MTGIWLDNPKYTPQPNPFSNSGAIAGNSTYQSGVALLAEYTPYTIINSGQLSPAGNARTVILLVGGSVTNQAGGVITGGFEGVDIEGVGVVTNSSTITGTYAVVSRPGSVITNGTGALISGVNDGIFLGSNGYPASGSGTVTNLGTVRATGGASLGNGIVLNTQTASVSNQGTVIGTGAKNGAAGLGVAMNYGGMLTNSSIGVIRGYAAGVSAGKGQATVTNAGSIAGIGAGVRLLAGGSVVNTGSITANASTANGSGVYLKAGGTVTNQTGGYIYGKYGIRANIMGASVKNFGVVMAPGYGAAVGAAGFGVFMSYGGTVGNYNGATIQGGVGINISGTVAAAVYNYGTVTGNLSQGVFLYSGGRVSNAAAASLITAHEDAILLPGTASGTVINFGTLSGRFGVRAGPANTAANTVRNFGTIIGTSGTALSFGTGGGRLVEFPQATISGRAIGGGGTLELGVGTQSGSIGGFGSLFSGFATLQFDAGKPWTVEGSTTGLAAPTITGFGTGDTIEVDGFVAQPGSTTFSGSSLVLANSASSLLTLTIPGAFSTANFQVSPDGKGGTNIVFAPCYAAGTRILTAAGEVAVEALAIGDRVVSAFGGVVAVVWLGHRRVDCRRHPRPQEVWPVRVAAGAFGDGLPRRDLRLSPDHAVFVDGALIPIRYLVNGATIAQEKVDEVTYWHVELPAHDVVFAEGLAAESYLDTGNRGAFANGGAATQAHPDFALRVWEAQSCAPLVHSGAALAAARAALLARAEALGHRITGDAAIRLVVDGRIVVPVADGPAHVFAVAREARNLRLLSRAAVPAAMTADGRDHRRLGVAVSRIALNGNALALTDPRLGGGWHDVEADGLGGIWRWTDGDAGLAIGGGGALEVDVAITQRYWHDDLPQTAAA